MLPASANKLCCTICGKRKLIFFLIKMTVEIEIQEWTRSKKISSTFLGNKLLLYFYIFFLNQIFMDSAQKKKKKNLPFIGVVDAHSKLTGTVLHSSKNMKSKKKISWEKRSTSIVYFVMKQLNFCLPKQNYLLMLSFNDIYMT